MILIKLPWQAAFMVARVPEHADGQIPAHWPHSAAHFVADPPQIPDPPTCPPAFIASLCITKKDLVHAYTYAFCSVAVDHSSSICMELLHELICSKRTMAARQTG